jgi:O-acetyl-ADP-ribose deacetylase (regulator of RNase III)
MIEFKTGNIFDTTCNTIVNTVNCEGVMGKGIALECKKHYPFMFKCYQYACRYGSKGSEHHTLLKEGGDLYFWYNPKFNSDRSYKLFEDELEKIHPGIYNGKDNKCILNFATKVFWRNPSKLEWIERGLYNFCEKLYDNKHYYDFGPNTWTKAMSSIAWPKLGCSNGGLNWELQVKPLMIKYLTQLPEDMKIEIYE